MSKCKRERKTHRLEIVNMVSDCSMACCPLDLTEISADFLARDDVKVFPAAVTLIMETRTTGSIFHSSQVVISGAKNYYQSLLSAWLIAHRLVQDLSYSALVTNFRIQNIVTYCSLGFKLNLDLLFEDKHNCREGTAQYDASTFVGLNFRCNNPPVGYVIFTSGNVVATGLKQESDIEAASNKLEMLYDYELGNEYRSVAHLHIPASSRPSSSSRPPAKIRKYNTKKHRKVKTPVLSNELDTDTMDEIERVVLESEIETVKAYHKRLKEQEERKMTLLENDLLVLNVQ